MTCDANSLCSLDAYLKVLALQQDSTGRSSPTARDVDNTNSFTVVFDANGVKKLQSDKGKSASIRSFELHHTSNVENETSESITPIADDPHFEEGDDSMRLAEELDDETTDVSSCDESPPNRQLSMFRPSRSRTSRSDTIDLDGEGWANDRSRSAVPACNFDVSPEKMRPRQYARKMRKWRPMAKGRFEKMLLDCIINTDNIAPNYEEMFIAKSTIQKLEEVTSLSLYRPKAFSFGVLKGNKVTGAILYGPPGTGKTLLARGVAKQSGFNMLSISASEIWQKCHGEDEKMIKAVFSMARKLHPCIVFVDEADSMLGARKAGEKRHIKSMLNQFLMEWDGLVTDSRAPFVLLATNRPFDLDPAVLRRAPMQILLDIPTMPERVGILKLLLRGEKLEPGLSLEALANLTQNYTGSDLKNLCVTTATNCVRRQPADGIDRVLGTKDFLRALDSIRATNIGEVNKNEFRKFQGKLEETSCVVRQHEEET